MMPARFDPDRDLPQGVTEADLLDWVEADSAQLASADPASALGRISTARQTDGRLAALLDAMRVDRAALGSLESPAPPASVANAVLEEHERQALLALSDMASMGPRAATERPDDEAFSLSAMPGWFRPALAVAAVLALAFGAWQLLPLVLPQPGPEPGPVVAIEDPVDETPIGTTSERPTPPEIEPVDPPMIARAPRERSPSAREILTARLDLPVDQAMELAAAGRLLIVVGVRELDAAREAARRVGAHPVEPSWRLREANSELVAALASPHHARLAGMDESDGTLFTTARGPLGQIEIVMASTPTVSMAETSTSPEALLALMEGLARLGEDVRAVPLDEPLPGAGATPGPSFGDQLLWWNNDPATWEPWAAIPVRLVESR